MSSLKLEDTVRFEKFWTEGDCLCIKLPGKKALRRHKSFSRHLTKSSVAQISKYEILGLGEGVYWPQLDEDLSAAFLIYPEKFVSVLKKKKVA